MNNQEVIAAVRAIAVELSCRGAKPGRIEPGTRERIGKFWRPLIEWHNHERVRVAEAYSFVVDGITHDRTQTRLTDPPAAVVLRAVISRLVRVYGVAMDRHTVLENEQAIAEAAAALPSLCDRIEALMTVDDPLGDTDDKRLAEALSWWNDGDTWPTVNSKLGREPSEKQATTIELRRFAKKKNITIRKGNAGRKKAGEIEQ